VGINMLMKGNRNKTIRVASQLTVDPNFGSLINFEKQDNVE